MTWYTRNGLLVSAATSSESLSRWVVRNKAEICGDESSLVQIQSSPSGNSVPTFIGLPLQPCGSDLSSAFFYLFRSSSSASQRWNAYELNTIHIQIFPNDIYLYGCAAVRLQGGVLNISSTVSAVSADTNNWLELRWLRLNISHINMRHVTILHE